MYNIIKPNSHIKEHKYQWKSRYINRIHKSVLDLVGNTPLIKLNRIPKDHGLSCEIYAKCEFMNPSGSSKDRIALEMLKDAEKKGYISENIKFVEPTSGNTGIGVAFNAALLNKKCTIIMGEKNSSEKVNTMRLLGAEVIQTNTSSVKVAQQMKDKDRQNVIMLNQFENHINPRAHYENTGLEILDALGQVDVLVVGVGTGGTVSGTGQRIKENYPQCTVIVAEPDGSTMFNEQGKKHPFLIEGIGGTFLPIVFDKSVVDGYEVVNDKEAFLMAREVIQKEGLLCGGSSGAAMAAAIKYASKHKIGNGKRIVVVLSDGIRNYMSKFVCDQWMEAHYFMEPPQHTMRWWKHSINNLTLAHNLFTINPKFTCVQALARMGKENVAIVVNENGYFIGAVTKDNLRRNATNATKLPGQNSMAMNFDDPVTDHLFKDCRTLAKNGKNGIPTIGLLSRILDIAPFVVIGTNVNNTDENDHFLPDYVVTAGDVLNYILHNQ